MRSAASAAARSSPSGSIAVSRQPSRPAPPAPAAICAKSPAWPLLRFCREIALRRKQRLCLGDRNQQLGRLEWDDPAEAADEVTARELEPVEREVSETGVRPRRGVPRKEPAARTFIFGENGPAAQADPVARGCGAARARAVDQQACARVLL